MRRAALLAFCLLLPSLRANAQTDATRDSLVRLADDLRRFRQPAVQEGVPDYSPAAEQRWRDGLTTLRARHAAFRTSDWSVPDQVDHILVGTQLAALDFDIRVLRAWERDPSTWVDLVSRIPYASTPVPAAQRERVVQQLRAVPRILSEARTRLTRPSAEHSGIAVFALSKSDGVNQGEPRRDPPPEGVIAWYEDFLARARGADRELVPDIERALTAVRGFRD
jgi:hypothetical protein